MRTAIAGLVSLTLLLAACSPGEESAESTTTSDPTTSTSSTSTSTSTTNTSLDDRPPSLLNGLPVDDPTLLDRRILAVKIDNHRRAIPQSGIDQADMVIELNVEGITRFITLWHESDIDYLGPNRSGRPTDATLLAALNRPTFVISGAQPWIQNLIRARNIPLLKELSEGSFRISSRRAPHNLYVDTFVLRETADERGYPDNPPDEPLWNFGPLQGDRMASHVDIEFGAGNRVYWDWDETQDLWLRTAYGAESMFRNEDGAEGRVGVRVLIALYTEPYTASPSGGQSGSSVPASRTTGQGRAFVFADGKVTEGTWERETETEWFTLRTETGRIMNVPPGQSWVSLVPSNRGLSIDE
ncbi:MAG TPA: DUF3048 domain-containing protein [Acidimicrobiia bacterium]|nr:DUF3048 domain-containing protein [Acidimicrobiia bacterium]